MRREGEKVTSFLAAIVLLAAFLGAGMVMSYWLFESVIFGAIIGLASYLLILLFVMIADLAAINRELADFRNGKEPD